MQLVERNPIEGTPFAEIIAEDVKFIALGRLRVSEYYKKDKDPKEILQEELWNIVGVMSMVFCEKYMDELAAAAREAEEPRD